jgi:predicted amidohydrolase
MRIGLAQTAPRLGDVAGNLDVVLLLLGRARERGCDLVVFPECALSGYMFDDPVSAAAAAVTLPGPQMTRLVEACRVLQVAVSADSEAADVAADKGCPAIVHGDVVCAHPTWNVL